MEEKSKICIICHNDSSKYKCPSCQSFYCSISCYKLHKNNCDFSAKKINEEEHNEDEKKISPLNLDEDEDIILSNKRLSILKTNKSIMTKLNNKKLFKILKDIDSTKYKKRTLEKMMNTDPDFREFTMEILQTLGFLKNNEFIINDDGQSD